MSLLEGKQPNVDTDFLSELKHWYTQMTNLYASVLGSGETQISKFNFNSELVIDFTNKVLEYQGYKNPDAKSLALDALVINSDMEDVITITTLRDLKLLPSVTVSGKVDLYYMILGILYSTVLVANKRDSKPVTLLTTVVEFIGWCINESGVLYYMVEPGKPKEEFMGTKIELIDWIMLHVIKLSLAMLLAVKRKTSKPYVTYLLPGVSKGLPAISLHLVKNN